MIYLGSKARIAKELIAVIDARTPIKDAVYWIEPFVGGANMLCQVDHPRRVGYDVHGFVIAILSAVRDGWDPPHELTLEEYNRLKVFKKQPTHPEAALIAFAGFPCSFGAKWFGGYARNAKEDNYSLRARSALLKQAPLLKGCQFYAGNYRNGLYPPGSIIYCDPPYAGTTQYRDKFDHDKFWQWVRERSKESHVYVSEYNAPEDFECIWSKETKANLASQRTEGSVRLEKLFVYKGANDVR